jgi:nucleotide-binding universal stress UspA family protein
MLMVLYVRRTKDAKALAEQEHLQARYTRSFIPPLTRAQIPKKIGAWDLAATGLPFKVILKTVEKESIDLLVMNVHGKRGLDRSLLDSTAERVVRAATCPVLTIPPKAATQRKRRPASKVA